MLTRSEKRLAYLMMGVLAALVLAVAHSYARELIQALDAKTVLTSLAIPLTGLVITLIITITAIDREKKNRTAELYKDYTGMMQSRTEAWFETRDVIGKIKKDHPQYVSLWTIATFYARLGFLFEKRLLDEDLAIDMFAQTFIGWEHVHFEKLGDRHSSEMRSIEVFKAACVERRSAAVISKWRTEAEERVG